MNDVTVKKFTRAREIHPWDLMFSQRMPLNRAVDYLDRIKSSVDYKPETTAVLIIRDNERN